MCACRISKNSALHFSIFSDFSGKRKLGNCIMKNAQNCNLMTFLTILLEFPDFFLPLNSESMKRCKGRVGAFLTSIPTGFIQSKIYGLLLISVGELFLSYSMEILHLQKAFSPLFCKGCAGDLVTGRAGDFAE